MNLFSDIHEIALQLRRIADTLVPLQPNMEPDTTSIDYNDEQAILDREERQRQYYELTGLKLDPDEEPPLYKERMAFLQGRK